jgi:hypothetical protein
LKALAQEFVHVLQGSPVNHPAAHPSDRAKFLTHPSIDEPSSPRLAVLTGLMAMAALVQVGCGGSSGDVPAAPAPSASMSTLNGTAAIGAPIIGGNVEARCADGLSYPAAGGSVKTVNNGRFDLEVPTTALPCALRVSGGTPVATLHSLAVAAGAINVTPLTDLATALAVRNGAQQADLAAWFANGVTPDTLRQAGGAIASASTTLNATLQAQGHYGVPQLGGFDAFRTPFTPVAGDPYDELLERLRAAAAAAGTDQATLRVNFAQTSGGTLPAIAPAPSPTAAPAPAPTTAPAPAPTSAPAPAPTTAPAPAPTTAPAPAPAPAPTTAPAPAPAPTTAPAPAPTPLAAVQALAGSYNFDAEATATSIGDISPTPRGLRSQDSWPACTPLGAAGGDSAPWAARVVVGADGSVKLQNPQDAGQAITLVPGSVSTDDTTVVSKYAFATTWSMKNPGSTVYQVRRSIRYSDGVHPTPLTEHFDILLGVSSAGTLGNVQLSGATNSPRMAFCSGTLNPQPSDPKAPLRALAGTYTSRGALLNTSVPWSSFNISADGSLAFNGTGPSIAATDIARIQVNRRNDTNNGADASTWALSVYSRVSLNGDTAVDKRDVVHLFLDDQGAVRDVAHLDRSNQAVEALLADVALPAFEPSLAAQLAGNGIVGKVGSDVRVVDVTQTFARVEIAATTNLDFFAGRNRFPEVPQAERRAWRISARPTGTTGVQAGATYPCRNGDLLSNQSGSAVLFDTGSALTSVGSGYSVQPTHNTRAGGLCEVTIGSVTKTTAGAITAVEGQFRALTWNNETMRYIPAVGFFRYAP